MILRGGAAKVLNALARNTLCVAAGYVTGVPVIVVLIFGVACVLLGRAVRAR